MERRDGRREETRRAERCDVGVVAGLNLWACVCVRVLLRKCCLLFDCSSTTKRGVDSSTMVYTDSLHRLTTRTPPAHHPHTTRTPPAHHLTHQVRRDPPHVDVPCRGEGHGPGGRGRYTGRVSVRRLWKGVCLFISLSVNVFGTGVQY